MVAGQRCRLVDSRNKMSRPPTTVPVMALLAAGDAPDGISADANGHALAGAEFSTNTWIAWLRPAPY